MGKIHPGIHNADHDTIPLITRVTNPFYIVHIEEILRRSRCSLWSIRPTRGILLRQLWLLWLLPRQCLCLLNSSCFEELLRSTLR
jgi:hypothetical protein